MATRSQRRRGLLAAGLGLVLACAMTMDAGARTAGHYPRPVLFDPRQAANDIPPGIASRFEALVVTETIDTTWVDAVRALNPDIRPLLFFSGTTVRDTLGWDPADSSTVQRLRRVLTIQNDWLLHDTNGEPITTWTGSGFEAWAVNLTPYCPVDANGERASTALARAMVRRFRTPGTGVASYTGWDGMMLDQMFHAITWVDGRFGNGPIDADANGIPDTFNVLNEGWRSEVGVYLDALRAEAGPDFMIAMNGDTNLLENTNGQAFEDCLSPGRTWFVDMYGYGPGSHGGYLRNLALSPAGPNQFCVFYARYYEGDTTLDEDRFARLAAGSSCLGDGYYILERFDAGVFSPMLNAPTYTLDVGVPEGNLLRVVASPDTLYERAFSKAYVQVNPFHRSLFGVPARDAAFTFYAVPDTIVVAPGSETAFTRWTVPPIDGNPAVFTGLDVRVIPLDEEGPIIDPGPTRVTEWDGQSGVIEVTLEDLAPASWYLVDARALFRTHYTDPTPALRFLTSPDPADWTPPQGAGAEGDARWQSALGTAGPDGPVHALLADGETVFAGGAFTHVGSTPANRVAVWDGDAWAALGGGLDGDVHALALFQGGLVAGGSFSFAGTPADVARWTGAAWEPLGESLGSRVSALVVEGGQLYAGGAFDNGLTAFRLARWDGDAWTLMGPVQKSREADAPIPLLARNGRVVSQGPFILEGGTQSVVAEWVNGAWSALGGRVVGDVYAMTVHEGELYVGGDFTAVGGTAAWNVAKWTESGWVNLGAGLPEPVHALASVGGRVFAGGVFDDDGTVRHLAQWDGSFWSSVGTGVDGDVHALAASGDVLVAGGAFQTAGVTASPFVATWLADDGTNTPTDPGDEAPDPTGVPTAFAVTALRPNPASTRVSLTVALPAAGPLRADVFDAGGRLVATIAEGSFAAGRRVVAWDGTRAGRDVAGGVYFVRVATDFGVETRKVVWAR